MTCTEHKLDMGLISIFCYTDTHCVQKANEPIGLEDRCAYKDIPLRQYSFHQTGHMEFSSHREMKSGAAKWCPSFWAKKRENSCIGTAKGDNIDVICIAITIFSHYMDPVSYDFAINFGKMPLLVALFNALTSNRGTDMLYIVSLVA